MILPVVSPGQYTGVRNFVVSPAGCADGEFIVSSGWCGWLEFGERPGLVAGWNCLVSLYTRCNKQLGSPGILSIGLLRDLGHHNLISVGEIDYVWVIRKALGNLFNKSPFR